MTSRLLLDWGNQDLNIVNDNDRRVIALFVKHELVRGAFDIVKDHVKALGVVPVLAVAEHLVLVNKLGLVKILIPFDFGGCAALFSYHDNLVMRDKALVNFFKPF